MSRVGYFPVFKVAPTGIDPVTFRPAEVLERFVQGATTTEEVDVGCRARRGDPSQHAGSAFGTSSLCRQKSQGGIWVSATDPVLEILQRPVTIGGYSTMRRDARIAVGPQLTLDGGIGHTPTPEQQPIRLEDDLARGYSRVVHSDDYAGTPPLPGIVARSWIGQR